MRKEDFEAFHVAVLKVLTESDPRHELAPEEQWQAGVLGKLRAYSGDLRHGLATTLALMGAYGDEQVAGARLTSRDWASLDCPPDPRGGKRRRDGSPLGLAERRHPPPRRGSAGRVHRPCARGPRR